MNEAEEIQVADWQVCVKIWLYAWAVISAGATVTVVIVDAESILSAIVFSIVAFLCSLPGLVILSVTLYRIEESKKTYEGKLLSLYGLTLVIAVLYGAVPFSIFYSQKYTSLADYLGCLAFVAVIYAANVVSILLNTKLLRQYFGYHRVQTNNTSAIHTFLSILKTSIMQQNPAENPDSHLLQPGVTANKILIKSIITAALILVMLIPTSFIQSLINERQDRQQEVVEEVSSKWALPQTLSAPYLVIPYTEGKSAGRKQLIILPDQLNVSGSITEESRPRSIYKVLLYKSKLNFSGNFHPVVNGTDSTVLQLNEARLCFGLSDFRGIEDKLSVTLNNTAYALLPGLPTTGIDSTGLSVPVTITAGDLRKELNFTMDVALRGSGSLHFLPLGAYSNFNIQSSWPAPSFDGNTLPAERKVSDTGFLATWKFNAANLPFTSVRWNEDINTKNLAFGVSLVQPADQYVKSMRSAKYAILIIGLTFALFFIFELMQKKPVHPVQYVLVGMALVIFYTLLVSISEIMLFDYAYTIAAVATIILIALYAKSHFNTWRSAIIFTLLLAGLYGFIYVLISLEDTALLVGSIALFIVVAVIMYVTRKINWYQPGSQPVLNVQP